MIKHCLAKIKIKKNETITVSIITENDEIMCITSQGKSLRVPATKISEQGRAAQGVRILEISQPDMVIGIDKIAKDDSSSEEE